MTNPQPFSTVLVLLIVTASLPGCSRQKSASVANASAAPAGAQAATPGQGRGDVPGTAGAIELAGDYRRQCGGKEELSQDCETLRSLLVAEVLTALRVTERSRDQRGTKEALTALDLADEPEIVIAACRILGQFPETPGISSKILPHVLESRYVEVQRMAARLLAANPDPGLAEVGRLWIQNHGSLTAPVAFSAYDEYPDFPAHYPGIGFPKYPGAEWFSPADSDRSIGWSTADDVAAVSRWFGEALHVEGQAAEQWMQTRSEQAALALKSIDQSKITRIQQLMEKAVKGDQAATAEIEKLTKEMDAASQNATGAMEQGVDKVALPPPSSARDARWFVAQKKDGRVSRLVLVYPMPSLKRTVIQLIWDRAEYASAWPDAKN